MFIIKNNLCEKNMFFFIKKEIFIVNKSFVIRKDEGYRGLV